MILVNNLSHEIKIKTYFRNVNVPSGQGKIIESSFKIADKEGVNLSFTLNLNSNLNKNTGFISDIIENYKWGNSW
jgi:hypothetical protein